MRGVVKGLSANVSELEIYGFENGYKGLIYGDYRHLTSADFSGILTKGGTILGSSRQPFKLMRVPALCALLPMAASYADDVTFRYCDGRYLRQSCDAWSREVPYHIFAYQL